MRHPPLIHRLHAEEDAQHVAAPHRELVHPHDNRKGDRGDDEPFDRVGDVPREHHIADDEKHCLVHDVKGQDSLVKLRNILRNDRIRDAARRLLFKSIRGNTINFCLNKQVAYAGHVSFSEETAESPLGPIRVIVTAENPSLLVEWLAEKSQ